jgi:hypothetical protein
MVAITAQATGCGSLTEIGRSLLEKLGPAPQTPQLPRQHLEPGTARRRPRSVIHVTLIQLAQNFASNHLKPRAVVPGTYPTRNQGWQSAVRTPAYAIGGVQ